MKLRTVAITAVLVLTSIPSFSQWRPQRTPVPQSTTQICNGNSITLPFNDVGGIFFCTIANIYFSGVTSGTSATTYSPSNAVTRDQMAAFVSGTMSATQRRAHGRTALGQHWIPIPYYTSLATFAADVTGPIVSDGEDFWVATDSGVERVHASDLKVLTAISIAGPVYDVLAMHGLLFALTDTALWVKSTATSGAASVVAGAMSGNRRMTFDGSKFWIVSTSSLRLYSISGNTTGAAIYNGVVFDGTNVWATAPDGTIKKLNSDGSVATSVAVGTDPQKPIFDGVNIWVPNRGSNNVTVVRPTTATVAATLTTQTMTMPMDIAFDGERIMVVDPGNVHFFRAFDFAFLTSRAVTAATQASACSDGVNFFVGGISGSSGSVNKF